MGLSGEAASWPSSRIGCFKPEATPFLMYWLPPIIGAVILFTVSFTYTASKAN